MSRNVNNATLELVKHFEGFYPNAYRCPAGVLTIGYGHTEGVTEGQVVSQEEANQLLAVDLAGAGKDVLRLVDVELGDNQYGALVSFTFNLGAGNLAASTLLKRLNKGEYDAVPEEMARWNKATVKGVKQVLKGLVRRRAAEGELWLSPDEIDGMPQRVEES